MNPQNWDPIPYTRIPIKVTRALNPFRSPLVPEAGVRVWFAKFGLQARPPEPRGGQPSSETFGPGLPRGSRGIHWLPNGHLACLWPIMCPSCVFPTGSLSAVLMEGMVPPVCIEPMLPVFVDMQLFEVSWCSLDMFCASVQHPKRHLGG